MVARVCRVCQGPSWGRLCARCFAQLYPEAASRASDTAYEHALGRTAVAYEQAREADEAEAPVKRRGPA